MERIRSRNQPTVPTGAWNRRLDRGDQRRALLGLARDRDFLPHIRDASMKLAASLDAEHRRLIGAILERIMVEVRFAPQPGRRRPSESPPQRPAAAPLAVALLQVDADSGENGRKKCLAKRISSRECWISVSLPPARFCLNMWPSLGEQARLGSVRCVHRDWPYIATCTVKSRWFLAPATTLLHLVVYRFDEPRCNARRTRRTVSTPTTILLFGRLMQATTP